MPISSLRRRLAREIIIDRAPSRSTSLVSRIARQRARENYRFAAPFVKGKAVLDVGGGLGLGHDILFDAGASNILSIDLVAHPRKDADGKFQSIEADFLTHDFGDDRFDIVICLGTIFYLPDPDRAVAKIHKLLQSGGLLIANCINQRLVQGYFGMPLQKVDSKFSAAFDQAGFKALLGRNFGDDVRLYAQQPVTVSTTLMGRIRFWLTPLSWPFARNRVTEGRPGTEGMFVYAVAGKMTSYADAG